MNFSYAVSLGLVDRLAFHVGGVRGPLPEEQSASNDLLLAALKFLTSLVDLLHLWYRFDFNPQFFFK